MLKIRALHLKTTHLALVLAMLFSVLAPAVLPGVALAAPPQQDAAPTEDQVLIHYHRKDGDYDGWGLHVWGLTAEEGITWDNPLLPDGEDAFGIYWLVDMQPDADVLNYLVHNGDAKDPGPDQSLDIAGVGREIWLMQGKATQFLDPEEALVALAPQPVGEVSETQAIIHYARINQDYDGWGLHIWGPTAVEGITWGAPLLPAGEDDFGIYWIIEMTEDADHLNYIVHKGDTKDPGPDQTLSFDEKGREIWLIQGSAEQFADPEAASEGLLISAVGDITTRAQAHWITRDIIAWPANHAPDSTFRLHYAPDGGMKVAAEGLTGGESFELEFVQAILSVELAEKWPHLHHSLMLRVPAAHLDKVPDLLRGQIAVSATTPDGATSGATALQIPGVLDDLYAYDGALGVTFDAAVPFDGAVPSMHLWAPTAQNVTLHLFDDHVPETTAAQLPMTRDDATGVWSLTGEPDWNGKYYLYEVEVFVRQAEAVVHNLVTDPYSFALSMNSQRSQIIDLTNPALFPDGWGTLALPLLAAPEDMVLYELHVRDFSIRDETVPAELRGTYMAFTQPDTAGMQHLGNLSAAGLTHIHLLPAFDIATIEEDASQRASVDFAALASLPSDSPEQQAAVNSIRDQDGFNWGYDPFHYTVPEGSYAVEPNGETRVTEFRWMVHGLHEIGLRVVMDVVYNHTNASGQSDKSVLDRIVPGYYHRLNADGAVETSTCCQNTATEHKMMEKLMIDSIITWATAYHVGGFRFDLMGHHMVENMVNLRAALDALTLDEHGVDGKNVYIYGEGWNFGEVANDARGQNATQLNMPGTSIGTFNDRIRDAVRGGSPFSGVQEQGFLTGLYYDPNETALDSETLQLAQLLALTDQVRLGLVGNLADYMIPNHKGGVVAGSNIQYNGSPAGYAQDPQETINYISAHDNETLFDAIQYKAPLGTPMAARVRMQNLGVSLVMLGQGVPFFHAGTELLRSKSLDRDSYNSSDWFNALDFTYQDNNWGHGLPIEDKNGDKWDLMAQLLGNPDLQPTQEDILAAQAHFQEMLQIRASSPLFRLQTAEQVMARVVFHNTGPDQIPGLIVMTIADKEDEDLDPIYDLIVVLFNATPDEIIFPLAADLQGDWVLHPLQQNSADAHVRTASYDPAGSFTVPARTTAVFVIGKDIPAPFIEPELPFGSESEDMEDELCDPVVEEGEEAPCEDEVAAPDEASPASRVMSPLTIGLGVAVLAALVALFVRSRRPEEEDEEA